MAFCENRWFRWLDSLHWNNVRCTTNRRIAPFSSTEDCFTVRQVHEKSVHTDFRTDKNRADGQLVLLSAALCSACFGLLSLNREQIAVETKIGIVRKSSAPVWRRRKRALRLSFDSKQKKAFQQTKEGCFASWDCVRLLRKIVEHKHVGSPRL